MKNIFLISIVLLSAINMNLFSQSQSPPKLYSHKIVVQEIIQTKSYTYLYVKERVNNMDSLQWMALPLIEAKVGDIYYYESGLQMGQFQSRELNRTFNQILFLGSLSTSPEVSAENQVPATPVTFEDTSKKSIMPAEVHTVTVKEVIQTSGYTYLRVVEDGKEEWVAIVKIPAKVGQVYTYNDAAKMTDFTSKELNRTFKEILFISGLKLSSNTESKRNIKLMITPGIGEISISELTKNKNSYAGKSVKMRGEVTKYSSDILNNNWLHIEDGTSFSGKHDLTVTTNQTVKVGDIVIVEGLITLDKDFGSGYFFDIIMEDAKLENQ